MPARFTRDEFLGNPGEIMRAALAAPVFITEGRKPSLVVLSIEDYERLGGRGRTLLDVLMPGNNQDFEFDPPRANPVARPAEFD